MNTFKMYRVTGSFGLAMVVFWLSQFPLYMQGDAGVSVYDGAALGRELYRIHAIVFTRLLLDLGLYLTGMVFAAGFRDLIRRARPDYEWVGTLVFGAWVVWIGVSLVANGLEGGSALETLRGDADPSAVRALTMGTLLIYNGAIAFAMTALFLAAAGYATFGTGVLPRWTGWLAYLGVALCVASVPALFGGPVDPTGFYNAGGWGPVIMASFPPALWFVAASLSMLGKREERVSASNSLEPGVPSTSGLASRATGGAARVSSQASSLRWLRARRCKSSALCGRWNSGWAAVIFLAASAARARTTGSCVPMASKCGWNRLGRAKDRTDNLVRPADRAPITTTQADGEVSGGVAGLGSRGPRHGWTPPTARPAWADRSSPDPAGTADSVPRPSRRRQSSLVTNTSRPSASTWSTSAPPLRRLPAKRSSR